MCFGNFLKNEINQDGFMYVIDKIWLVVIRLQVILFVISIIIIVIMVLSGRSIKKMIFG